MRKFLITTAIISTIVLGAPKLGSALVVSDPGSYARQAQQLANLKKQLEEMQKQFEELKTIKDSVTGNLGRGKGILKQLGDLQTISEKITKATHNFPHMDLEDFDLKNADDMKEVIDNVFKRESDIIADGQTAKQRQDYQQRSVKGALESSEILIAKTEDRLQSISELADEIDKTESMKDAMDLNNRLLGEILLLQQEMLFLNAQFVRANTALSYQGVSSEQQDGNPNKRKGGLDDVFNNAGNRSGKGLENMKEKMQWDTPPFMQ